MDVKLGGLALQQGGAWDGLLPIIALTAIAGAAVAAFTRGARAGASGGERPRRSDSGGGGWAIGSDCHSGDGDGGDGGGGDCGGGDGGGGGD